MSWSSIGNFNTIIGSGVRTRCLATYNDELYVATDVHASFSPQVWKYDDVSWTLVDDSLWRTGFNDLHVFDNKLFGITYGGVSGGADGSEGIWSYNGSSWTHELDTGISGMSNSGGNFVEYGAELYAVERSNSTVWKRIVTGTWILISDSTDAPNKQELGIYAGDMYLTGRVGSVVSGTNYIRIFSGGSFTTAVFTEASGGLDSTHGIGKALAEFDDNLYSFDRYFAHEYDGVTTILSNTFFTDANTRNGERDFIVFNSKLWTGHSTLVYKFTGSSWSADTGGNIGYSQNTSTNAFDPPGQFAKFGVKLYCCAGPGHVYVSTEEEPPPVVFDGYVKGIAISKSKANDDRLWLTAWKPTHLFLRSYIANTLTAEIEVSLGSALLSAVNAKTVIAYPYTPITGGDGKCYVYGRMLYNGNYRHVMLTTDAGDTFEVIEDGWGDEVCGALVTRLDKIYCVRNKTTQSYLYKENTAGELEYVSTIPFPVNPYAFALAPDNRALFAGCNVPGFGTRVVAAAYPFTDWVDITFNYPTAGEVNAIVPL